METPPEGLECNLDKKKEGSNAANPPCDQGPWLYQEPAGKDVMDCDEHAPS